MAETQSPLILCMENANGEEVALKIEPNDTFQMFLDNSKLLLGYDVDINSITCNQPVSLNDNIYTFLINAEENLRDSNQSYDQILEQNNESDDLVYVLDDGTQIRASQIQFDNDDPLIDLTAEKIPFVKYNDAEDEKVADIGTVKDVNIIDSPVSRWSKECSPKCSFVNSLPFKLVCSNTSNFEAQFSKYLESTKTYTTLNPAGRNKSPRSLIRENYKNYEGRDDFYTREDILNMFKDSPVTSLPYDGQFEKRRHVRKTDPTRLVHKSWNSKAMPDVDSITNDQDCFVCGKIVENNEKLYLFDKEDQMLHRCEQRKFQQQLKIICERCLTENFKPSRMKSPSQSLNNDEYLVIKNNQQYIFQKITSIDLKKLNIDSRKNSEFVKVEIGPDGEIITKPIDNDVNDVIIVKDEKKEGSSDVEIIEPDVEIDIDNIEEADEHVKEFLGKYQCDTIDNKELKCRFCECVFTELSQVIEHGEEHRHDLDDDTLYPCPLCDYGYTNFKWLQGHLKAAHDTSKKDDSSTDNNDKKTPKSSPVARRTRSAIKKHDTENDGKNEKNSEETITNETQFTTEVKQECVDSSDESIWIVQTGDDDELQNLLKVKEDSKELKDRKKHKCFNCSQIFPSAESLSSHKCRKRGRKRKSLLKEESVIFIPSEEDFLKRAQGRLRRKQSGDSDLLVMRSRKKKNRDTESQIVTCHNCNESFTSKVRLKFHMQFHDTTNLLTPDGQYACSECEDAKFPTETELFDHVHFQHDKQKRWQCPVKDCGKTFFLRATLTKHSRTHTDTRRYVCVTCGKRFLDKQTLDEHGVTHLQIKPFQCHICLKQLTRRSRLRMHLRAHEEELSPALVLVCAICSRAFRDHVDAQDHATKSTECIEEFTNELKEETEATEQLSPTSGIVRHSARVMEFSKNKTIEREANNAESEAMLSSLDDITKNIIRVVNIEKAFRCEYCEDVFYLEDALNNHRVIHKGVQNPFTCHICKVSFATYSRCTTHKTTHGFYKRSTTEGNDVHTGPASAGILGYGGFPVVKHFLCEDCGRSYLHWTYLQVHRRMKHANENYIFKCNQCELTFPNSWSVAYHRKKVHGKSGQDLNGGITKIVRENYRIPCRDCDQVLPNKTELYRHRKKEHCDESLDMDKEDNWSDQVEDNGTTICSKCGHNLHNVTALQKHIKEVHDLSHSHTCPVCPRTFRSASIRNEHVRTHTGERPYPCDVCGVAFRRSTAMRNHRLIHTGVRAWACSRCPKRFRIKSDLKTHLRLKHPAHLAVIEIEGTTVSPEEVLHQLTLNNIHQDKVIEITMITFAKDTTSVIPSSSRALCQLGDAPRMRVACERPTQYYDVFQPRRGRGIAKTPRRPKILRGEELAHDDSYPTENDGGEPDKLQDSIYPVTLNVEGENLSSINVQLLLQDSALVNGNQMVELQLNDEMLLE